MSALSKREVDHAGTVHRGDACGPARARGKRHRAGLADPAAHARRALCRGRLGRRQRPHHGAAHGRNPRPAGGDRERRRGGWNDGLAPRVARAAGRLSVGDRQSRQPRRQPDALQAAALQLGDGLRAGRPRQPGPLRAAGAQGPSGEHAAGVHRLCEGEPGEAAIRLGRRRLDHAHGLHPAQHGARHRDDAHSLSRHRTGVAGSGRRPARLSVRAGAVGAAADSGQRGEAHRAAGSQAHRRARRTFRPRRSRAWRTSRS